MSSTMGRPRERTNHPSYQKLQDDAHCETIQQVADKMDLSPETVRGWADRGFPLQHLNPLRKAAKAMGLTLGQLIDRYDAPVRLEP